MHKYGTQLRKQILRVYACQCVIQPMFCSIVLLVENLGECEKRERRCDIQDALREHVAGGGRRLRERSVSSPFR